MDIFNIYILLKRKKYIYKIDILKRYTILEMMF